MIKVLLKYYEVMYLDRIEFDSMQVLNQINYINSQLKSSYTLTKICQNIGIGRTTIRDRFLKEGYTYNKELNTYINDKSITEVNIDKNISHKNNTIVNNNSINDLHSIQDFNNIKNDLLELIKNKDDIMLMLSNYKSNHNVIEIPQLDINNLPEEMQKSITTKSIKIYEPVYNLFNDLCKSYSSIKKQDLISLALYEFYNRYKK